MPAMDADDDDAEMGVEDLSDEDDGAPMTHWGARLMGHAQAERAAAAMRMRGFDFEGGDGPGPGGDDAAIPSPSGVGDVQRGQRRTDHLRRQRQRAAAAHRAQAEAAAKRQQRAAAADEEEDLRAAEPVRHRPINAAAAAAQPPPQPQRNIGWRRIAAQSGGAHAGGVIRWAVDCRLADDPLLLGMPLTDYDARLSAPTFFEMLGVPEPEPGEREGNAAETDDSQSEAVLQEQLKQAYAVTALRTRRCARGSTTLMSVAPGLC
eukprot:COSAG01_NODE_5129_length_4468_cov_4.222477_3_plen_263_part_00